MNIFVESLKQMIKSRPFIQRELSLVARLYEMSSDELRFYSEARFLKLFNLAASKSSFYRNLLITSGIRPEDITSLEDLALLPILTKELIKEAGQQLLTVPGYKAVSASTSGSTGSPLTIWQNYEAIRLEQAYLFTRRLQCGFCYGDRLVSIRGNLPHSIFKKFIPASNTLHLSSYNLNEHSCGDYFKALSEFRPKAIEGYPSSLYALAIFFANSDIRLEIPICFTASESLLEHQRRKIEEVFNTKIFDSYGLTERTISLVQLPGSDSYLEEPGYGIVEYGKDNIITTGLINFSFPMIRYRVEDVVERDSSGSIVRIVGRNEDYIICKDGTKVGRLDHIFKGITGVSAAQLLQKNPGTLDIRVVPETVESVIDQVKIRKNLALRINEGNLEVAFTFIKYEQLIKGNRDKVPFVIKKLQ